MAPNHGLASDPTTGAVSFAYNAERGDPWHHLGTPVNGYGTIDEMLLAANADYTVELFPLAAMDDEGNLLDVPNHVATTRTMTYYDSTSGEFVNRTDILGVVGRDYVVEQNREAAEFAYACVGASTQDAIIDTMGVMRNGAEFFTYVRLEPLVLDPNGIDDTIEMGLAVRTSHNGSLALCAYPTATRLVCRNTVTMSMEQASRSNTIRRIRHTLNKDQRKHEAVIAMGIANAVRSEFEQTANLLLSMPATWGDVERCAEHLWPQDPNTTSKRGVTIHENRMEALRSLWLAPTNSGSFGENRWTVWQTIGEYLDHFRGLDANRRAMASMDPDSPVSKKKDKALRHLLAGTAHV